ALTQTAMLHVRGSRVDRSKLEHNLRIFQTSSPSYVLVASVAECIALLEEHQQTWFAQWHARLDKFYAHAQRWQNIELFSRGELCSPGHTDEMSERAPFAPTDPSKLLIRCDAERAGAFLRARGIEPEYVHQCRLLCLTSPCDTDDMMDKLTRALDDLDNAQCAMRNAQLYERPVLGELSNGWRFSAQRE
ncbi:MAG: hypothetical protein FWB76_07425, partial [Oscillospiraceae bacterium]|nr:hypothetical protein [Oscillospiraceae bacterium]